MALYKYTAISRNGDRISGELEALNKRHVLDELDKQGHFPVEVSESKEESTATDISLPFFSSTPSPTQITLFTRELALLLKAGLPIDRALNILQQDASQGPMKTIIEKILGSINDGKSVYEAMQKVSSAFPPIYINMVRVAEASGALDKVLERIADTREKEQKIRSKAVSAMLYPGFLILTAIGAIIVMLVFVVPGFKDLILNSGGEIPDTSKIVVAASDWLIENGTTLAISLGAIILLIPIMLRNSGIRQGVDQLLSRLPLIGGLMKLGLTIRFCRTLGSLLENGVDLPQAMELTKNVLSVKSAETAVAASGEALRKGKNFIDPLAEANLFPPVVINMLRVGEETGNISKSSLYLADMYEEKLETAIQRTLTILEPIIILIVSVFVAGIIISIISSVLSINDLAL